MYIRREQRRAIPVATLVPLVFVIAGKPARFQIDQCYRIAATGKGPRYRILVDNYPHSVELFGLQ